jgi:hypothetical protein
MKLHRMFVCLFVCFSWCFYDILCSLLSCLEPYMAVPLNIEHYVTRSNTIMTRIYFIIRSESSIILGSNIEPLLSVENILKSIPHVYYQQCTPFVSFTDLFPLRICIPFDEISSHIELISRGVIAATGKSLLSIE